MNLFLLGLCWHSPERLGSLNKRVVKDFLFVDAVSGTPLKRQEKVYQPPIAKRARKSSIIAVLIALVAFLILLATWAFS